MVKHSSEILDAVFGALADPTRRSILERLAWGESRVTDLAEPFDMSLPAISKHLRILEEAGLLTRQREGRVHRIRLKSKTLKEAVDWLEYYRQFWETRLDSLEKYLSKSKK